MKHAFRALPGLYVLLAILALIPIISAISKITYAVHTIGIDPTDFKVMFSYPFLPFYSAILIGAIFILICIFNAVFLFRKKKRTLSLILSGASCLSIPLGTIVGAASIYILTRTEVARQYAEQDAAANP